jgi:hypothetical protein
MQQYTRHAGPWLVSADEPLTSADERRETPDNRNHRHLEFGKIVQDMARANARALECVPLSGIRRSRTGDRSKAFMMIKNRRISYHLIIDRKSSAMA